MRPNDKNSLTTIISDQMAKEGLIPVAFAYKDVETA